MESRKYFHGRELARKRALAHERLLTQEFACKPETFFGLPVAGSASTSLT